MTATSTTKSHDDTVRDMIVRIMAIVTENLPELAGTNRRSRRHLVNTTSLPDEFFEEIAIAIDDAPEAGVAIGITAAESRDTIGSTRAYTAFAGQLENIARGVLTVVAERRNDVGQRALAVYAMIKSANRPALRRTVSNVESLRRALGRTGRGGPRKKSKPETPDPNTTPETE